MLTGQIKWVGPLLKSKKGGVFRIISFDIFEDDVPSAQVFLDPANRNYSRWEPMLAEGNILAGLVWKNREKRLIDGDSPVELR